MIVKKSLIALIVICLLQVLAVPVAAQKATTIKLATLVPERSVWGVLLREMGAQWKEATDGRVALRIYPGGVAGDDPDVVRKMRIGQLHAATLTVTGLGDIDEYFKVFEIPFFYDSYEEYFHVVERLQPILEKRLEDKGFVFIHWGHGGWIHLFTTEQIHTLDEFKQLKFFVWAGSGETASWWQKNGFRPVPLAATDMATGLQTGMIEALPSPPLAALAYQWFRSTPYMLDLGFAPLIGATVMTKAAWKRLSPEDQQAILSVSQNASRRFATEVPIQDSNAIDEMTKRGLTVTRLEDEAVIAGWRKAAADFSARMREEIVPIEIYDLAVKARQEYRSQVAARGTD